MSTGPIEYFYKGDDCDFIIFVKSKESVDEYIKNPSPGLLTETVALFKIFSNRDARGSEGELGESSKSQLTNEFGSGKSIEEILDLILKKGKSLNSSNIGRKRWMSTNQANQTSF